MERDELLKIQKLIRATTSGEKEEIESEEERVSSSGGESPSEKNITFIKMEKEEEKTIEK